MHHLHQSEENRLLDVLENDELPSPDTILMSESLKEEVERALSKLAEREAEVIRLYFGFGTDEPLTLEEIGEKFNLTRERVRQIKEKAIRRLRNTTRSKELKKYLGLGLRSYSDKILFIFISLLIISACTTSSTLRYSKQSTDEQETKDPSVRFTSADDSMIVDLNLDLKDPSDLPAEEPDVDVSSLLGTYQNEDYTFDVPGFDYTTIREKMLMEVIKYLGTPYKYGGNTLNGMDCSAFTQIVYKECF